jgi:hypothetical protein
MDLNPGPSISASSCPKVSAFGLHACFRAVWFVRFSVRVPRFGRDKAQIPEPIWPRSLHCHFGAIRDNARESGPVGAENCVTALTCQVAAGPPDSCALPRSKQVVNSADFDWLIHRDE